MLIQQGNLCRIECEMAERKQRQIEITARFEQDEILRQVIHLQKLCILYFYRKRLTYMSYILTDFRKQIFPTTLA